ncbi:hypothetical protein BC628DRAFT_525253 [Trametes gibbosa]|nr:hypothetical protein BC628DRAFT_525253 [Trametes gibbosa]
MLNNVRLQAFSSTMVVLLPCSRTKLPCAAYEKKAADHVLPARSESSCHVIVRSLLSTWHPCQHDLHWTLYSPHTASLSTRSSLSAPRPTIA